jgi:hypothetical protein
MKINGGEKSRDTVPLNGYLLKKADSRKPVQTMAKSFLTFPAGNWFSDF